MADVSPQALLNQAKCYQCAGQLSAFQLFELALLAQIAEQTGGIAADQVISTSDANPNTAGIVPDNPTKGAEFYQDPAIANLNFWKWSISTQTWIQYSSP